MTDTAATNARTVTIDLPDYGGEVVYFNLLTAVAISGAEVMPRKSYTVTLDSAGVGSVDLPTPDATGDAAWLWTIRLPDHLSYEASLAYDAASISLADWLVADVTTETANAVQNLVAAKADKDTDAVASNLAMFSNGNPVDASIRSADVSNGLALPGAMRLGAAITGGSTTSAALRTTPDTLIRNIGEWVVVGAYSTDAELATINAAGAVAPVGGGAFANSHSVDALIVGMPDRVVNIRLFGARGDGSTDDTTAINNAASAAASAEAPLLLPASDENYRVSGQIDLRGIRNITWKSPVRSSYTAGASVLVGGSAALLLKAVIDVFLFGSEESAWTSGNVGVRVANLKHSRVHIRQARAFATGIEFTAENGLNSAYNVFELGEIGACELGLHITEEGTGWNNENIYINGDFTCSGASTAHIKITQPDGGDAINDHHFYSPCFQASEGINGPIFDGNVSGCSIRACRCEGEADYVAQFVNGARWNVMEIANVQQGFAYDADEDSFDNVVHTIHDAGRAIVPLLDTSAFGGAYGWSAARAVPGFGLMLRTTGAIGRTQTWSGLHVLPDDRSLYFGDATCIVGTMVDVSGVNEVFVKQLRCGAQDLPDLIIRCYDSSGDTLSGDSPYYVTARNVAVYQTDYYRAPAIDGSFDEYGTLWFHGDVDHVFIGVTGVSGDECSRGMQLYTRSFGGERPETWTGYDGPREARGNMRAGAAPNRRPFDRGTHAWKTTAAAGGAPGWVCVSRVDTTVDGDEVTGQTVISVADATGMTAGDYIYIELDSGIYHYSTISSISSNDVTIADALGSQAGSGNAVVSNLWKEMANLDA